MGGGTEVRDQVSEVGKLGDLILSCLHNSLGIISPEITGNGVAEIKGRISE